jgi:large subunit ribosomal protein L24
MKIREGDRVVVLQGKDRGTEGVVLKAMPAEQRLLVEGVNVQKHHDKPRQAGEPGGIREAEGPIHVSNVALVEGGKPTRVGFRVNDDGNKVRVSRRSGGEL